MKGSQITFILIVMLASQLAIVSAQSKWTDAFTYFNQFNTVKEGAFKQLFGDPNDPTLGCYNSFLDMREFWKYKQPLTGVKPGQFLKNIKFYIYYSYTITNWYHQCNLDDIVIEMAKRVQSVGGFLHMIINLLFRFFAQTGNEEWTKSVVDAIDQANISGLDEDWEKVGYPIGQLIAEFFNFEVPDFDLKYGVFTKGTY
ncbi:UNKNOWN [Stylonychia lemnae]|uniref:Uncharacterized protein n=1 Tax=Stylonychia lemnae TaxID=5949 RepID=A0A077ZVB5_STYLE|nr:UNKNOWN [Stylonychia lemnae]|eukprot:CDW73830.1 UNKNOWN [Stylonychia lemnae]